MKAVFLDRDGTINFDYGYETNLIDLTLLPDVDVAIRNLNKNNFNVFIITNQSCIARKICTYSEVINFNNQIIKNLKDLDAHIMEIAFCPHKPKYLNIIQCQCRKPNKGLIKKLLKKYPINLKNSWIVGDKLTDIELGRKLFMDSVLVSTNQKFNQEYVECKTKYKFNNLLEASFFITNTRKNN